MQFKMKNIDNNDNDYDNNGDDNDNDNDNDIATIAIIATSLPLLFLLLFLSLFIIIWEPTTMLLILRARYMQLWKDSGNEPLEMHEDRDKFWWRRHD